jgi:hypothetical protein
LQLSGRRLLAVVVGALVVSSSVPSQARRRHDEEEAETEDASDEEADDEAVPTPKPGGPSITASSAVSAYSDTDAVHVITPTVAGGIKDAVAGWSVDGRYLVDAVSAASVDIVSTASGHWKEVRNVGALSAEVKSGAVGVGLAGGVSHEPDYLSVGGGGTVSLDLLDKNFTPFVGGSYGHDDVGRTGLPKTYWRTMQKGTVQLGATFVVGRATIEAIWPSPIVTCRCSRRAWPRRSSRARRWPR